MSAEQEGGPTHWQEVRGRPLVPAKVCGNCGHEHREFPGGALVDHGYYFQCQGGCHSTMFVPTKRLKP